MKQIRLVAAVLLISGIAACKKNKNQDPEPTPSTDKLSYALPVEPAIIENSLGKWIVYDLHLLFPEEVRLEHTGITYKDRALVSKDSTSSSEKEYDKAFVKNVWIPYPTGFKADTLYHTFNYHLAGDAADKTLKLAIFIEPSTKEQPVVGLPIPAGDWLAFDAPSVTSHHTNALSKFKDPVPDPKHGGMILGVSNSRYAIDLMPLKNNGLYAGDGTRNEDWYGFGMPISAVSEGTVLMAVDNIPDQPNPGSNKGYEVNSENFGGNLVYIDHGNGLISLYAHLQRGSVVVKKGDKVKPGQLLGKMGNSGDSWGAHLHYHMVSNKDNKQLEKYTDGVWLQGTPYKFDHFTWIADAIIHQDNSYEIRPVAPILVRSALPHTGAILRID